METRCFLCSCCCCIVSWVCVLRKLNELSRTPHIKHPANGDKLIELGRTNGRSARSREPRRALPLPPRVQASYFHDMLRGNGAQLYGKAIKRQILEWSKQQLVKGKKGEGETRKADARRRMTKADGGRRAGVMSLHLRKKSVRQAGTVIVGRGRVCL